MPPKIDEATRQLRSAAIEVEIRSLPPKLVCEKKAAQIYGMSVHWFRRKRVTGGGPNFIRLGRAVRYNVRDLDQYFDPPSG